uniref:Flavin reductase like domain-containing protein n=1 Tax=Chromera velia CCMP2878 TaxID=1169474 RepID=A0A0G4G560_9ALVE|eukprot:Cvel_20347.t1-p1 / transcript=Cvel_20347.t1 / gene=Cvel_20347 / organism=Chromera_velia_CCMP2878 / gene_product=Uncharacterized protein aq_928, putative / transcript_product=Uncharacterized protein aq_928, putative / location=Cvel_scaffold1819:10564-11643(+) / protein_length=360 / sequence_SO=supercontig / SO=protein_coding / is_pseudo=false
MRVSSTLPTLSGRQSLPPSPSSRARWTHGSERLSLPVDRLELTSRYHLLCSALVPRPISLISTYHTKPLSVPETQTASHSADLAPSHRRHPRFRSETQIHNLMPLSFITPVTSDPCTLMFSLTTKHKKGLTSDSEPEGDPERGKAEERQKSKSSHISSESRENDESARESIEQPVVLKNTLENLMENGEFVVNHVHSEIFSSAYRCSGELSRQDSEWDLEDVHLTPLDSVSGIRAKRVKESLIQLECKLRDIVPVNGLRFGGAHVVIGEVLHAHLHPDLVELQSEEGPSDSEDGPSDRGRESCVSVAVAAVNEDKIQSAARLGGLRYIFMNGEGCGMQKWEQRKPIYFQLNGKDWNENHW